MVKQKQSIMGKEFAMENKLLYDMKDLKQIVNLGRNKIYQLIRRGKFPKPIKIGTKSLWKRKDIEKWVDEIIEDV